MIQKIKTLLLSISALFILATPALVPATTMAVNPQNGVCAGANSLQIPNTTNNEPANSNECASTNTNGTSKVNDIIRTTLNVLSVIVGIVAVIMIIVGGFRYITSGGKQESVTSAKNTLLYAIIGLIIVALAQIIVKFVLDKAVNG